MTERAGVTDGLRDRTDIVLLHLVKTTRQQVLSGVGAATGGIREEVRERFTPAPGKQHATRRRIAALAASITGLAVACYAAAALIRNRMRTGRK